MSMKHPYATPTYSKPKVAKRRPSTKGAIFDPKMVRSAPLTRRP